MIALPWNTRNFMTCFCRFITCLGRDNETTAVYSGCFRRIWRGEYTRELIDRKSAAARSALQGLGIDPVWIEPVSDDPQGRDVARARVELAQAKFDVLIVCLAGWIPSHAVVDTIGDFVHKPLVLWGLTGEYIAGRLVTTADQAGTTALRDTLDGLGFRFKYVYDTPDQPQRGAAKVKAFCEVARAAALLRGVRVGMMGYRDMNSMPPWSMRSRYGGW